MELRRGAGYHYDLDGSYIASPWAEAKHGAGIRIGTGHEPFDVGDSDSERAGAQFAGRIRDAAILKGSVNGGSFGPDVDVDRVGPVRQP